MRPPSTGATIGATLDKVMNSENSRAAATPLETSAAIALASTIPPPPDAPWKNRQTTSRPADGASAHSTEASAQTRVDPSSSRRRPQASDIGPSTNCPTTMPMTSAVRVSWTADWLAPRSSASCGNAGRYRSIDSGPNAVKPPSSTVSRTRRRPVSAARIDAPAAGSLASFAFELIAAAAEAGRSPAGGMVTRSVLAIGFNLSKT